MNERKLLSNPSDVARLAANLRRCTAVTRFDTANEEHSAALAHAFSDLEESFRTILDKQLPTLVSENLTDQQIYDALLEIGEEFRHVLYHVADLRFFRYLRDQTPKSGL